MWALDLVGVICTDPLREEEREREREREREWIYRAKGCPIHLRTKVKGRQIDQDIRHKKMSIFSQILTKFNKKNGSKIYVTVVSDFVWGYLW